MSESLKQGAKLLELMQTSSTSSSVQKKKKSFPRKRFKHTRSKIIPRLFFKFISTTAKALR